MAKELATEQKEQILRLRKIREGLGYSQEQFADLLDISISGYKKIESYENQISLSNLKKLHQKLKVSIDYIMFGELPVAEQAWNTILNCTENDKIIIFLRLYHYFALQKNGVYPTEDTGLKDIEKILHYVDEIQNMEK